jgi:hypothetical protein
MGFEEFLKWGLGSGLFGGTEFEDFATDFLADHRALALEFKSWEELRSYLKWDRDASKEAMEAGRKLFKAWKTLPKPKKGK